MIKNIKKILESPLYLFILFHLIVLSFLNIILSKNILVISLKDITISDYILFNIYSFAHLFILYSLLILFITLLIHIFKKKLILYWISILLFAIIDILFYADYQTYNFIGIHLHHELVLNVIRNGLIAGEAKLGIFTIMVIAIIVVIFISLESFWLFYLSKKRFKVIKYFSYFITIIAIFSIFISFFISKKVLDGNFLYTLYNRIDKEDNLKLNYPIYKKGSSEVINSEKKTKIVFIIGESLRSDFFKYKNLPNINKYLSSNRCIISKKHYSGGHTTVFSIFSILYSIPSYYHQLFNKRKYNSYALDILKNSGYDIFFETSSVLRNFNGANYIIDQFGNNFYQFQKKDKEKYENVELKLIDKLKELYVDKKSLYLLFFYNTHYSYYYPDKFKKYTPILDNPEVVSQGADLNQKYYKIRLSNQYQNSILYLDYLFSKVLEVFKKDIDNNNLILVFTGDHGESFKEHGSFGHARADFHNERIQVPFFICLPKDLDTKNIEINSLTSHVDILPTIIDYLSNHKIKSKNFSTGYSILNISKNRTLLTISTPFPKLDNKFAFITPNGKLLFKQLSNDISNFKNLELFDSMDLNDKKIDKKKLKIIQDKYIHEISDKFLKFVK